MTTDVTIPHLDDLGGHFPPVDQALDSPNGLLAWGGDLTPETLLRAYAKGIFPWFGEGEPVLWWHPDPRTVIFPGQLHVSRRFGRYLRNTSWRAILNRDFEKVMRLCAAPRPGQTETWISEDMIRAYTRLHRLGYAQCLEIEVDGQLAGGIYGVTLGDVFFGESMFSVQTNGSKIAMKSLCDALLHSGYRLLDCQVRSAHLQRMGALEIPVEQFQALLQAMPHRQPLPLGLPDDHPTGHLPA